jgi:hypothetical protein
VIAFWLLYAADNADIERLLTARTRRTRALDGIARNRSRLSAAGAARTHVSSGVQLPNLVQKTNVQIHNLGQYQDVFSISYAVARPVLGRSPVRRVRRLSAPPGDSKMSRKTRICSSAFALGLAALWSLKASALTCPPTCTPIDTCTYVPQAYTTGAAGDVSVSDQTSTFMQQLVSDVVAQLVGGTGPQYTHTKILRTPPAGIAVGSYFTETYASETPPSSENTGEESPCSKPASPHYIQNMFPGASTYYEDAQPGILVKAMGSATCNLPADAYHIYTILNDPVPGGSCEKALVDYCGVPVSYALTTAGGDRTSYPWQTVYNAASAAWWGVYDYCVETESVSWLQSLGCDGMSTSLMCERSAWQFVNEAIYAAYPEEFYGLDACNSAACGWMNNADGDRNSFTDFIVPGTPAPNPGGPYPPPNYYYWPDVQSNGQLVPGDWPPNAWLQSIMLGAAKSNNQMTPGDTATGAGGGVVTGACVGTCDQPPIYAPANDPTWPGSHTANIPANILHAAARLGKTQQPVAVGSGISSGYDTCKVSGCNCSGGGGPLVMIKDD